MTNYFEKEHELLQLLYQNTNLQLLCNKISELIGIPIVIGDFFWNKLIFSEGYPEDDLEDQINRQTSISHNKLQKSMEPLFFQLSDRLPHILELTYMRKKRLICGIFDHNRLIAFLESPDSGDHFESVDLNFLQDCCNILGLAFHLMNFPSDKALSHPHMLLWNFFHCHTEHEQLNTLSFCPEFLSVSNYQLLYTEPELLSPDFLNSINSIQGNCWCISVSDGCIILFDSDDSGLKKLLRTLLSSTDLSVGASNIFSSLQDLGEAKRQAKFAYLIASKNHFPTEIYLYNDFKLHDLLSQSDNYLSLSVFKDETLNIIRKHDTEHKTEYERTLRTYLFNKQDIMATSRLLYIHKNTVIYRINKLRQLFNIDFNDCRKTSHLYLSFLIDEIAGDCIQKF